VDYACPALQSRLSGSPVRIAPSRTARPSRIACARPGLWDRLSLGAPPSGQGTAGRRKKAGQPKGAPTVGLERMRWDWICMYGCTCMDGWDWICMDGCMYGCMCTESVADCGRPDRRLDGRAGSPLFGRPKERRASMPVRSPLWEAIKHGDQRDERPSNTPLSERRAFPWVPWWACSRDPPQGAARPLSIQAPVALVPVARVRSCPLVLAGRGRCCSY
jgi:hypothetical protein